MIRLSQVLREYRWSTRRSIRDVAREVGIPFTSYSKFELGRSDRSGLLVNVLRWLLEEVPEEETPETKESDSEEVP